MKEIGALLKQKRESMNVTLEEVSSVTKINVKSLQAIEDGDLERLPAKTFVRGFVQTYAKYLGLNAQEVLEKLQTTLGSTRPKPQEAHSEEATTMRKPVNTDYTGGGKNIITAGAIILTIIAIAIIQRIVSRHEAELKTTEVQAITGSDTPVNIKVQPTPSPTPAPVPAATPVVEVFPSPTPVSEKGFLGGLFGNKPQEVPEKKVVVKEKSVTITKPTPTPSPAPVAAEPPAPAATPSPTPQEELVPQEIIVEALDSVTIKVAIDNKAPQDVAMAADQIQTFKAKGKIRLVTPNGGAINLIYNGKEIGVPGNLGQPKTMVFPQ